MAKIKCSNLLRVILTAKITNRRYVEQIGFTNMSVSRWKNNNVQPSKAQFVEIARKF